MPKIFDLDGKELLDTGTPTFNGFDMSGKDLKWANLTRAELEGANLTRAELAGANLTGANLTRVKFGEADLKDTILRHANLTDADLSSVKNLLPEQLAGTNLTRAKLPEHIKNFDGIKQVDDRIKDTGKFFLAMLAADAYSLLTLWSTKNLDFKLITDSSDATLPIFNTPLSIVKFCLVAPLVLLGAYVYFQLEMQRLWEELVSLPTIFPDGKHLDQRVYPWFVTSFVQRYMQQHGSEEAQQNAVLAWVLQVLIGFFVWLATPLVIIGFWLAYVKTRAWEGTEWLEILIAMCVVWGWVTLRRTRRLIGTNRVAYRNIATRIGFKKLRDWGKVLAQTAVVGVLFHILSFGLIYAVPNEKDSRASEHKNLAWWDARIWASKLTKPLIGYRPVPLMSDIDASFKPADWGKLDAEYNKEIGDCVNEIKWLKGKLKEFAHTDEEKYDATLHHPTLLFPPIFVGVLVPSKSRKVLAFENMTSRFGTETPKRFLTG